LRRRFDVGFDSHVAPNGVSDIITERGGTGRDTGLKERHDIEADTVALFVGTDYGPNREAAKEICQMAGDATDRRLDIHFLVVGSVCQSLSESPDNVTLAGFVPDLAPWYDAADIGLNPICSGSGTNIKLLEYLAHGLTVVTTDFGARGFDISHGEEALIVPEREFLAEMARLQGDPTLRDSLKRKGTAYVRQNHTWERISTQLRQTLVEHERIYDRLETPLVSQPGRALAHGHRGLVSHSSLPSSSDARASLSSVSDGGRWYDSYPPG
jgi:hypothetical protein